MKNSSRVVAVFVVVVLVASGCSYSEEAEPGVRNLARSGLEISSPSKDLARDFSDDCLAVLSYRRILWECLNESEQQRAAGLFNAVNVLVGSDDRFLGEGVWDGARTSEGSRIRLLKLLIDWEALEVLCYVGVIESMYEEEVWPFVETTWADGSPVSDIRMFRNLRHVRVSVVDYMLTRVDSRDITDRPHSSEETPVLEPVRYQHLCPSWMPERGWGY